MKLAYSYKCMFPVHTILKNHTQNFPESDTNHEPMKRLMKKNNITKRNQVSLSQIVQSSFAQDSDS